MNVDIYMAPKDVYHTKGLCGYLDGSSTNDLMHVDGTLSTPSGSSSTHYQTFSDSWRYSYMLSK